MFAFGLVSYIRESHEFKLRCECVPSPSGQSCLQYDSRLQAVSLQEAMASFPDLTLIKNETEEVNTLKNDSMCTTKECLDCHRDLQEKLKEIGMLAPTIGDAVVTQAANTSTCKKYRFARKDEGVYMKINDESSSEEFSEDEYEEEWRRQRKTMKNGDNRYWTNPRRMRRQAITSLQADGVIGTRFILSCSTKGVTADSSGLVSLCSSCWVWRRLPDNFSPQYINELLCDKTDNACLSGSFMGFT
uniref:Uncharacterized protein n=1 Tax=Heterorhabditis bacteriophora TaxID=37862 RepID=A0A1I7XT70_HETBA